MDCESLRSQISWIFALLNTYATIAARNTFKGGAYKIDPGFEDPLHYPYGIDFHHKTPGSAVFR